MTNKEFLIEVQKSCHMDSSQCVLLLSNLQKVLAKAAVDQSAVALAGLGVFTSHKHPEFVQENPQTGAMTLYPPRITYRMQTEQRDDAVSVIPLLAEYAKMTIESATDFVEAFVKIINMGLHKGEEVDVAGIGIFSNVKTHNSELQHVSYTPHEQMRELVNAPFSCFEPLVISEGEAIVPEEEAIEAESTTQEELEKTTALQEEVTDVAENPVVESLPEPEPIVENTETPQDTIMSKKNNDEIIIVDPDDQEPSNNRLLYTAIAVVLLACGFLVWLMFGNDISSWTSDPPKEAVVVDTNAKSLAEDEIETVEPEENTVAEEIVEETPAPAIDEKKEEIKPEPVKEEKKDVSSAKDYHRMMGADGKPVSVTLNAGERLTIIALNHFGDKAFWPYIFDANADRLKAPNLVQAGMRLYLPDPAYYDIDAKDPESLRKAKNRGAQLLK